VFFSNVGSAWNTSTSAMTAGRRRNQPCLHEPPSRLLIAPRLTTSPGRPASHAGQYCGCSTEATGSARPRWPPSTQPSKRTGYRVNPQARNLATKKATETHDRLFAGPNFAVLMRGAADALAIHDIPLVLIMAGTDDEQRRATDFLTAGHVDCVLLVSSHGSRKGVIADIIAAGVPAIACGVPLGFEKKMGYVAADAYHGALELLEFLDKGGRKRIATITGPQDTSGGIRRLEAYRAHQGEASMKRWWPRVTTAARAGHWPCANCLAGHPIWTPFLQPTTSWRWAWWSYCTTSACGFQRT